jgi:hypothetical protein
MRRTQPTLAAIALAAAASLPVPRPGLAASNTAVPAAAQAQAVWKQEFEEICAKTQDAMALSSEELKSLVERCDRLRPAIEALDESERKVYSRRLCACRDLYAYVLESRQAQDR